MPVDQIIHDLEPEDLTTKEPNWITRWGITVIFFIVCLISFSTWVIRYPDTIVVPITITASSSPIVLYMRTEGYIAEWMVNSKDSVKKDQVLCTLNNETKYTEILTLRKVLFDIKKLKNDPNPGILNVFPEMLLAGEFQRDYTLLKEYCIEYTFKKNIKSELRLLSSIENLENLLNIWESKYVLKSPIDGSIVIWKNYNRNSFVKVNSELCTIIPEIEGKLTGKIVINSANIDKIKISQKVKIELTPGPEEKTKYDNGIIEDVTYINNENNYVVNVKIENDKTYYDNLPIQAVADIIVQDNRVSDKIFGKLFGIFSSKKNN